MSIIGSAIQLVAGDVPRTEGDSVYCSGLTIYGDPRVKRALAAALAESADRDEARAVQISLGGS